ncbi:unnamed protein product [Arabidopsis thaliana]|uniref:(thale cress) hypothetical protein n=1 Tax=Arabidopsis thaliana TaxID=3702 RepID=A0A7G2E5K2_ARATH|nr:unnamed protein product [Arabidopsis thaliana]
MVESEKTKHTCLHLEISGADPIFVKGTWYHSRFDISVTDGSFTWTCNATEEEVAERAAMGPAWTKLEWRWKCKPSDDSKKITVRILDFLMEANIRLSEEVVNKTRSFEKMKSEAERCLAQEGETESSKGQRRFSESS